MEHSVVGYYPTYSVLYAVVLYGVTAVSHVNAGVQVSASFQISSLTVGDVLYTCVDVLAIVGDLAVGRAW